MEIQELYEKFKELDQVEALALGGSRASGTNDSKSDYDLYVYVTDRIEDDVREALLFEFCDRMEIGNSFFEFEDNIVLKNGIGVDIIYRNIEDIDKLTSFVLDDAQPMNGYTTCFWHNLRTCDIVFDKTGRFIDLQNKCRIPYPKKLKNAIIKHNMSLLSGCLPSYDKQIRKAFERGDLVSVNHRTAAFLESYFDVIFAINEMTHPGEKRLVQICREQCYILPEKFEENINLLFEKMFKEDVSDILKDMVSELSKVIEKE
ncbi:MAG: DUF4037 domain-containing protein [Clostridia bacterium]|nr:DUF4037 domain-containing protein [Clostridia bacterium]